MWNYEFQVPLNKRVRYICHTDCKNEADDQFTVAHVLMTDKLDVRGIVAGHFNTENRFDGKTATASYHEVKKILELMHLSDRYQVYLGAEHRMPDRNTPVISDGARFIVEEAMRDDERPLYIGLQGGITDLACAILMEPEICHRMTAIWIGGEPYPAGGLEFNLMQDIDAANVVFSSDMPVWQVPRNVYKLFTVSLAELQLKVRPYGKIGEYLFRQMLDFNDEVAGDLNWHGEVWNLGDEGTIAAIMDDPEQDSYYTMIPAPEILPDMTYRKRDTGKLIRVYHTMNARLTLEDFFAKLQLNYPETDS